MTTTELCPACNGTGIKYVHCPDGDPKCEGRHFINCPACDGSGKTLDEADRVQRIHPADYYMMLLGHRVAELERQVAELRQRLEEK
jgi:uncharacterized protein YceH (UPF0502 family)